MDLNPTFGHQELLETLSQNSGGTSRSGGGAGPPHRGSHRSGSDNHGPRTATDAPAPGGGAAAAASHPSSAPPVRQQQGVSATQQQQHAAWNSTLGHVDEAVRRLGHRLSIQAHGDGMRTFYANFRGRPFQTDARCSSFQKYDSRKVTEEGESAAAAVTTSRDEKDDDHGDNDDNTVTTDVSLPKSSTGGTEPFPVPRTSGAAKTGRPDRGERRSPPSPPRCGLVRKLTVECKERFQTWEEQEQEARYSRQRQQQEEGAVAANRHKQQHHHHHNSPQGFAFSQLALEQQQQRQQQPYPHSSSTSRHQHLHHHDRSRHRENQMSFDSSEASTQSAGLVGTASSHRGKGLLSAVMEGQSDNSTSVSDHGRIQGGGGGAAGGGGDRSSRNSPASQSISTKGTATSSMGAGHGGASVSSSTQQQQNPPLPRGRCLTSPAEGVANNGLDNAEGNLIVHENDSIVVPRKNIRTIRNVKREREGRARSAEFRVQSLQGQGTFAQVFQCLHVQAGRQVALKVIKNKPAYTRQAAIEIDIFQTLQDEERQSASPPSQQSAANAANRDYMVNLVSYFMHENHLCLVFELLGLNLYEVLKRRQFRGLPLTMVRHIIRQAVDGVRDLSQRNIVHCDLKPENMLLTGDETDRHVIEAGENKKKTDDSSGKRTGEADAMLSSEGHPVLGVSLDSSGCSRISRSATASSSSSTAVMNNVYDDGANVCKIKLIDFGSACFEGYTAHTYIQSRFYRSPEVLVGLPYDSAIDMWSLGCVAAELFLGLPILPGVHEHDQVGRISEMISDIPDWMLDQGSKATKYYVKFVPRPNKHDQPHTRSPSPGMHSDNSPAPLLPQWRIKTQQEFIASLSQSEVAKKGGLAKLSKQPGNRYFKRKKLSDISVLHAQNSTGDDRRLVPAFVHLLYGILDPDPWKRFTAFQASQHPFLTGDVNQLSLKTDRLDLSTKEENQANIVLDVYWQSPWDPAICRRKLLNVQKMREKQQAMRRSMSSSRPQVKSDNSFVSDRNRSRRGDASSLQGLVAMSTRSDASGSSPPNQVSSSGSTSASLQLGTGPPDSTGGNFGNALSWSGLGQPGVTAQLVSGNSLMAGQGFAGLTGQQFTSGPQSFQGAGYTPTEADFAQALQRPGVVPGTFYLGSSMTSQGTSASYQSSSGPLSVQSRLQNMQYGFQGQMRVSSSSVAVGNENMMNQQNVPIFNPMMGNSVAGNGFSNVGAGSQQFAMQRTNEINYGTSASSVNSGITMADAFTDAQQSQPFMLQQQLQYQQQNQQLAMFQQQQQQMLQQSSQHQQPLQQGQFYMPQQSQQPFVISTAPGGGYYYVATSASGQPIILQPVGMFSQQVPPQPVINQQGVQYVQAGQINLQQRPQGAQQQQQQQMVMMNPMLPQQPLPQQQQFQRQQPMNQSSRPANRYQRGGGTSM